MQTPPGARRIMDALKGRVPRARTRVLQACGTHHRLSSGSRRAADGMRESLKAQVEALGSLQCWLALLVLSGKKIRVEGEALVPPSKTRQAPHAAREAGRASLACRVPGTALLLGARASLTLHHTPTRARSTLSISRCSDRSPQKVTPPGLPGEQVMGQNSLSCTHRNSWLVVSA